MRDAQAYHRAYCLPGTPITCSSMGSTLTVVLGVTGRFWALHLWCSALEYNAHIIPF